MEIDPNHALAHAYLAIIASGSLKLFGKPDVGDIDLNSFIRQSLARAVVLQARSADVLFAPGWVHENRASLEGYDPGVSEPNERVTGYYEKAVRT